MGIPFPAKHGGAGLGAVDLTIFLEEASAAQYGAGTSYFTSVVLGGYNILIYGTESQQEHFLPCLISGACKFSFVLSEPIVGSDAASVELVAAENGDHFILNGTKLYINCAYSRNRNWGCGWRSAPDACFDADSTQTGRAVHAELDRCSVALQGFVLML